MVEKRFEKLGMPDIERFENYLPTAFNSELTLLQKVNKIIFDLIESNKLTNEMIDYLNKFIEKFDEKLYKTIEDVLSVWLDDGRLADVVRVAISEEVIEARTDYLGKKYVDLKERLDSEKAEWLSKANENEVDIAEVSTQLAQIVTLIPVIGDGVADDTNTIKAVLENALPFHKYQFPPNKIIKITSSINITVPIELDLNGCTVKTYVGQQVNTFNFTGSKNDTHNVIADITGKTIALTIEDAQNYNINDYVMISTSENYFIITGRDYKKGEIVRISDVDKSTGILTVIGMGTRLQYLASQSTKIAKINFIDYCKISNGNIFGTGTDNRQVGVNGDFVKNMIVENLNVGYVEVGIRIISCYGADVSKCSTIDINKYGTGYGVCIGGASQNINIHHNKFENSRHAITTTGYDGVCMFLDFNHNIVIDNFTNAGINTHGNARDVNISDNIIKNCQQGISVYSPNSYIHDNKIINSTLRGIYAIEAGMVNIEIKNNSIETVTGGSAIQLGTSATSYELNEYIYVDNNKIFNCISGGGIEITSSTAKIITANGNTISNYGYTGILISTGEQIQCNSNLIFGGTRNTYYGVSITGSTTPSSISAIYGTTCNISNNNLGKVGRGISVTNIVNLILNGNLIKSSGNYLLTNVTNLGGGEVYRSPDLTLYKLSVANDGTLTTVSGA